MSDQTAVSGPARVSIRKNRHLPAGVDVSFEIGAARDSALLSALVANAVFPASRIDLDSASVGVAGERSVPLGGPKGTVTFSGKAGGYQCLAVVDDPAEVTALLVRDRIKDDVALGLTLEKSADHRYVVLRWGYELDGAAKGSVALGVGPAVSFGAEGRRQGAYAIVRQLPRTHGSLTALQDVFDSWMLPAQFETLEDLAPGTWIVAEVDGSMAMTLGVQYGYDFNWVREDAQLGGLSGDIGLKVQAGLSATFGFEASGQYAIALGRPLAGEQLRLQLFRLNRKGLNFAYSASASAQGNFGGLLPDHFDEFVAGAFGMHDLQVLKELEKWTTPGSELSDLLAGVGTDYARDFLTKVTGIDARAEFLAARGRLVSLLEAWHALPHRVASTVDSVVRNEVSGVPELRAHLTRLATEDLVQFKPDLEKQLSHVEFFRAPFGKWLEAAALTSVLRAASNTSEYAHIQQLAKQTLSILDGSQLQGVLTRLQGELAQRIGLDKVEQIVDETTFEKADAWLKARLSAFLGQKVDFAKAQEIRTAIHRLLALRQTFFTRAREALTRKYEFQVLGTYQNATTRTALVDVNFDFGAPGVSAAQVTRLVRAAIDGQFEQILVQDIAGVSLGQGVLTHEIKRQAHIEVTMPFFRARMDHINTSLARMESIQSERGRLLVFDLHADDLETARGRFSSRFTVSGRFAQHGNTRVFDHRSMTHSYSFRQAVPDMRRRALEAQLKTYVDSYFPGTFGGGDASFTTWITDLDRTVDKILGNGADNFGNTLLALEVSASSAAVGAWALAPSAEKDDKYFDLSRAIQAQLRKLIPHCYFQDLANFRRSVPSAALLVYGSLPPATGLVVEDGRIAQFDDGSDLYWDIEKAGNIEALCRNSRTVAALIARLVTIHDVLLHAQGMEGVAAQYRPDQERTSGIIADALTTNGFADLRSLLLTERSVIREAHAAGLQIAAFLQARNSADALKCLAGYGAKVTNAFNSKIGSLFNGNELRPLGTLVFLEAARVFDPAASARPAAMLELTVLKERPSFDLRSFVEGVDAPGPDIVNMQKFVALS